MHQLSQLVGMPFPVSTLPPGTRSIFEARNLPIQTSSAHKPHHCFFIVVRVCFTNLFTADIGCFAYHYLKISSLAHHTHASSTLYASGWDDLPDEIMERVVEKISSFPEPQVAASSVRMVCKRWGEQLASMWTDLTPAKMPRGKDKWVGSWPGIKRLDLAQLSGQIGDSKVCKIHALYCSGLQPALRHRALDGRRRYGGACG